MKLKNYIKNNKGSGIVTILVAIVFLAAFGTLIAILSYTSMEMRASDRKGKENLYDASAVMEQVDAGIQEVCSSAIKTAYARTLVFYNDYGSNVTTLFKEKFRDSVRVWSGDYIDNSGNLVEKYVKDSDGKDQLNPLWEENKGELFVLYGDNYYYRLSVLRAMVVDDQEGVYTIDSPNKNGDDLGYVQNLTADIPDDAEPTPIVLKDVAVTFTKEGRTTKLTTDITIDYPSIGYSNNTYNETGLSQHACVAKGNLIQHAGQGSSEIHGSAYFGGVALDGAGSQMKFTGNGRFVCAGDLNVDGMDTQRFTIDSNNGNTDSSSFNTLWAQNVIVNTSSTVNLLGSTYVANDLVLNKYATANLGGSYFGFGNSYEDPAASSSIIVNDIGAAIDMTDLQGLDLAGFAFVGNSGTLKMGESVTVKADQIAYLLPEEMVYYVYQGKRTDYLTNPERMPLTKFQDIQNPGTEYPNDGFKIETETSFWNNKGADYYGIIKVTAVSETFPGSSDVNVYAFATFESLDQANNFFKDYFEFYPSRINKYVSTFVALASQPGSARTAANYFYIDEDNQLVRGNPVDISDREYLNMTAEINAAQFATLCADLNLVDGVEADYENPLEFILSEDIEDLNGDSPYECYYNENGAIVAIAANGDVTIERANVGGAVKEVIKVNGSVVQNANPDNVCLIITTGNITVNAVDFNGLLLTEGDIELKGGADLNKDPARVTLAYVAKSSDGDNIGEYIDTLDNDVEKEDAAWAVTDLVGYDNWKRSTED